jgi:hypothetical protein
MIGRRSARRIDPLYRLRYGTMPSLPLPKNGAVPSLRTDLAGNCYCLQILDTGASLF